MLELLSEPAVESRIELKQSLADTYNGGWDRVEAYREVVEHARAHPGQGSAAVASALGLPRSRIRGWVDGGSKPDPVRAIERADELGWFETGAGFPVRPAAAVLVGWIFAGGSIREEWFVPRFSVDHELGRAILDAATSALGLSLTCVERDDPGRGNELEPETDASLLGRYLSVLGAPVGQKGPGEPCSLPAWLDEAPTTHRFAFARAYVLARGSIRRDHPNWPVVIQEDRSAEYRDDLRAFLRDLVADPEWVGGDATISLAPPAAAALAYLPLVEQVQDAGAWPPAGLVQVLDYDLSATQAFDVWGVHGFGFTRSAWADLRGVSHSAVAGVVEDAEETIGGLQPDTILPTPTDRFVMFILTSLCQWGLTPTEALDYYFAGGAGKLTYEAWATVRGVGYGTAANNVSSARETLGV